MTTNTNSSRTIPAARFFASAAPNAEGLYTITDRTDGSIVATINGRAAARFQAATLAMFDPAPRLTVVTDAKPAKAKKAKPAAEAPARSSHSDCAHASSKLARAICRRDRAKADTTA